MIRVKGDPIERPRVTKDPAAVTKRPDKKTGRPRVHKSGADRQKAYRERRRGKA